MSNILDLGKDKTFPVEAELYTALQGVLSDYDGRVSLLAAIGALELAKAELTSLMNELDG